MHIQLESELLDGCQVVNHVGHHTIIVDEEYRLGGTDLGPNPMQLFLSSIASSYAITCQQLARKKQITLKKIKITVECDAQDFPGDPTLLTKSLLNPIIFSAEIVTDLPEERQQNFLLNVDRLCPLYHTLKSKNILFEKSNIKSHY